MAWAALPLRRFVTVLALVLLSGAFAPAVAQQMELPSEEFKVGTFEDDHDRRFVGLVLRDELVVDLAAAMEDFEETTHATPLPAPKTVNSLIERYEFGLKGRLYELVDWIVESRLGTNRAWYVHDVADIHTEPAIMYPEIILSAAVNYYGHISEGATQEEREAALAERQEDPGVPYLFIKPSTRDAVIGDNDDILIPYGNENMDWECELGIVVGKKAKYVPADQASDHIFGYTILLDMSNRQGRPGGNRFGSDWFVGKGRDSHAPLGPWIVPKEFMDDPQDVRQHLTINGETRQDSRSSDMIHTIDQIFEYGSWVLTLNPGAVVAGGSPQGTAGGYARMHDLDEIPYLNPGDELVCSIEGIGSMNHTLVQEERPEGYRLQWEDRGFGDQAQ